MRFATLVVCSLTVHGWTAPILFDGLLARRARLRRLTYHRQRLILLVNSTFGAELKLLAGLALVPRALAGYARLCAALSANAQDSVQGWLCLKIVLLLAAGLLDGLDVRWSLNFVQLTSPTARSQAPAPARCVVSDVSTLQRIEPSWLSANMGQD